MAYIKLEDLKKFPIRRNHYDKEHGNEHFVNGVETVLEYAEFLPKYEEGLCPQWISVDERLPDIGVSVLIHTIDDTDRVAWRDTDSWFISGAFMHEPEDVTHWMPLPKSPKGE